MSEHEVSASREAFDEGGQLVSCPSCLRLEKCLLLRYDAEMLGVCQHSPKCGGAFICFDCYRALGRGDKHQEFLLKILVLTHGSVMSKKDLRAIEHVWGISFASVNRETSIMIALRN